MNISGYSMIGVYVDWKEFHENKDLPGCEHEHGAKFCPECGAVATKNRRVPIEGFDPEAAHDEDMGAYKGLQLVRMFESDDCHLGKIIGNVSGDNGGVDVKDPDIPSLYKEVDRALKGTPFENHSVEFFTIVDVSC